MEDSKNKDDALNDEIENDERISAEENRETVSADPNMKQTADDDFLDTEDREAGVEDAAPAADGTPDAERDVVAPSAAAHNPVRIEPAKRKWYQFFRWGSKRDRQLAALTTGYQELVGMMGSIRSHLEMQSNSQERLVNALDHLPQAAEGLRKMGDAAEKQAALMSLMRERLEAGDRRDRELAESINRFNDTLLTMNRSNVRMTALKAILILALIGLAIAAFLRLNRPVQNDAASPAAEAQIAEPVVDGGAVQPEEQSSDLLPAETTSVPPKEMDIVPDDEQAGSPPPAQLDAPAKSDPPDDVPEADESAENAAELLPPFPET